MSAVYILHINIAAMVVHRKAMITEPLQRVVVPVVAAVEQHGTNKVNSTIVNKNINEGKDVSNSSTRSTNKKTSLACLTIYLQILGIEQI